VTLLTEFLRSLVPKLTNHASGEYEIIVFGVLLIVIIRWMPQGIVPWLGQFYHQRLLEPILGALGRSVQGPAPASTVRDVRRLLPPWLGGSSVQTDARLTSSPLDQGSVDAGSGGGRL
jgi:hypothetical protein